MGITINQPGAFMCEYCKEPFRLRTNLSNHLKACKERKIALLKNNERGAFKVHGRKRSI